MPFLVKLMKHLCLIDDVLQHHGIGNKLIVDGHFFLFVRVVGSEHASATEAQEVREFVEGFDRVRAVADSGTQSVVSDPVQ